MENELKYVKRIYEVEPLVYDFTQYITIKELDKINYIINLFNNVMRNNSFISKNALAIIIKENQTEDLPENIYKLLFEMWSICTNEKTQIKDIEYFTDEHKKILIDIGYTNEKDLLEIEKALDENITTYSIGNRDKISRKQAIEILGTKNFLISLGRSTFHYSTVRESKDKKTYVYFDSSNRFKEEKK